MSKNQSQFFQINLHDDDDLNGFLKEEPVIPEWIYRYKDIENQFREACSCGPTYGCLIKGTDVRGLVLIEVDEKEPSESENEIKNNRNNLGRIRFKLRKTMNIIYQKVLAFGGRSTYYVCSYGSAGCSIWKQLRPDVTNKILNLLWEIEGTNFEQKAPTRSETVHNEVSNKFISHNRSTEDKGKGGSYLRKEKELPNVYDDSRRAVKNNHELRYHIYEEHSMSEDQTAHEFGEIVLQNDQFKDKKKPEEIADQWRDPYEGQSDPPQDVEIAYSINCSMWPPISISFSEWKPVPIGRINNYDNDVEMLDVSETSRRSEIHEFKIRRNAGLMNLGNTCYMNSVLQCLTIVPWDRLRKYRSDIKHQFFTDFIDLMQEMTSGRIDSIYPCDLKSSINSFDTRFNSYEQQDAHEFLTFIIYHLNQQIPESANEIFSDMLCGKLENITTISCREHHILSTTQDMNTVSLPVKISKQPVTVKDAIEIFLAEEQLDDEDQALCRQCKNYYNCSVRLSFDRLPEILVLHLKKFDFCRREKLDVDMRFPFDNLCVLSSSGEQYTYDLHAVCNHSGSLVSGHYTAYVRSECRDQKSNLHRWFMYNDFSVDEVTREEIDKNASSAYLLFYKQSNADNKNPYEE